jgi:ABC-type glycerol-3-phosphate transport system permease component
VLKRESPGDRVFIIINHIFLVIICFLMLYPILFVLGRSFMSDVERAVRPLALIPRQLSLSAYEFIFLRGSYVGNAYKITISRTIIGSLSSLFFSSLFAYVLSRREYPLKNPLTLMVVFTMWFNGGLIPNFLLIRALGLTNNFLVYILPGLISAWNMLILRNFFMAIPESVYESARIDGASDWTIFIRIVLPLSTAALATIGLFYAVGQWNAWFDAMIYNSRRELWTMQLFLREIVRNAQAMTLTDGSVLPDDLPPAESVQMATIVVTTIPILCLYPFLQKYFVKGVMVGSLKG